MSRCKFCGGQIDWIWSQERGGYVKVDAEPVFVDLSGGEVTFITDEGGILREGLAPATGDHIRPGRGFSSPPLRWIFPIYQKQDQKTREGGETA